MKRPEHRYFRFYAVALLFAIWIGYVFISAGTLLKSPDTPEKSDAIIVPAGQPSRAFYAADLYSRGYAARIYISKPVREQSLRLLDELEIPILRAEDIYRRVLVKRGVPDTAIQVFGNSSVSTLEEAEALRSQFSDKACRLLVVTSPFHVRRTRMIFNDVLKHCTIRVVGTPYEEFPDKWWTKQEAAGNVLLEAAKIIYYKAGGRFGDPSPSH